MYFVRTRKNSEEQDGKERPEKSRRERYQRSDSARLLLLQQQQQQTTSSTNITRTGATDEGSSRVPKLIPLAQTSLDASRGAVYEASSTSDFRPEELPDGAFYRPKKDLTKLQTTATTTPSTTTEDVAGAGSKALEQIRPAEYIGTFSVSGVDKEARERHMESQLEEMRSARDRRPVNLIISNAGVKVILHENNNVFMEHSLKRIWYATCDPEYCQFSFLAREPKTSAEVQYCHAFVTQTSQQAEELISLMGEAFRSTDIEAKKPPTFHELIEQQVQQQQAKYRETEQEAKNALEQKLKEIATPTPFSERAQFRMEQRRKSEDVSIFADQEKVLVDQLAARHHLASADKPGSSVRSNRRSEIPTRPSTPQSSPLKRNSVPPQAAALPSSVPSIASPLSIMAIKESLESKSSNTKFKGSPVTALKNEIDRRLSMVNGDDLPPVSRAELRKDLQTKPVKQQPKPMINRPLPLPPSSSKSPLQSRHSTGAPQPLQQSLPQQLLQQQHHHHLPQPQHQQSRPAAVLRHSMDDYHLPRSSSSQIPLSSNNRSGAGGVVLRDSPKRRQPRPMSEIATSSSGGGGGAAGGRGFPEEQQHHQPQTQQQQVLLGNYGANVSLSTLAETGADGRHSRRPSGVANPDIVLCNTPRDSGCAAVAGELGKPQDATGAGDGFRQQLLKRPDGLHSSDSGHSPTHQNVVPSSSSTKAGFSSAHLGQSSRLASFSEQDTIAVPRYQNDSPFLKDRKEGGLRQLSGFESLMCMDRSHIHDETLRNASWYQAGLPREIALEILQQEDVGSFIVRDSSSHPGCYALSVRVPKFENASGISHYLILRTHRGVKLKGLDKEWSSLAALVTHHTVLRELLPCTLRPPKVRGQEPHLVTSQSHGGVINVCVDNQNMQDPEGCGES